MKKYAGQGLMWVLCSGLFVGVAVAEESMPEVREAVEAAVEASPDVMESAVAPAASPMEEMRTIQMKLQQISMQLTQIQQQAFQAQEVLDAFAAYEAQVRAKMIALSPDAEEDIQTAEDLVEELRSVENPMALDEEELEAFQEKYMQFQQTVQRLHPVEQQASQDPEIQSAQSELEELVKGAMNGINPNASAMMDEREELIERYIELEMMQQESATDEPSFDFDFPEF